MSGDAPSPGRPFRQATWVGRLDSSPPIAVGLEGPTTANRCQFIPGQDTPFHGACPTRDDPT